MKTRLLGLAVVLVAMAFIINALALTSATVSGTTFAANIVNSSTALIGVVEGSDPDITFTDGPTAAISIDAGKGIQADSSYTFSTVFGVVKNSDEGTVYVDVSLTDPDTTDSVTATLTPAGGGSLTNIPLSNSTPVYFNLTITAGNASAGPESFSITVSADKSGS